MAVWRAVAAVIVGYVLSQGINGLHVYYWYIGDRTATAAVMVGTTVVLFLLTGVVTGLVTAWIGAAHGRRAAWGVAALVAVVTVGNIVADVAAEPLWHKLVVLLLMAPVIAYSGQRFAERMNGEAPASSPTPGSA